MSDKALVSLMSFNRQVCVRDTRLLVLLRDAVLLLPLLAASANAQETVTMTVDAAQDKKPISQYIYGINIPNPSYGTIGRLDPSLNLTVRRMGGTRWQTYNWVNNASNSGSDFKFPQNDAYLGGDDRPGSALFPAIDDAQRNMAALLVTVPMIGYVSRDKTQGDVRLTPDFLETRFCKSFATKNKSFSLWPADCDKNLPVYQDEFVNWVKTRHPLSVIANSYTPIWFALDNEPELWKYGHKELHPHRTTYAELVDKSKAYAAGIKAVAPHTLIFGPVPYGWNGFLTLQNATDGCQPVANAASKCNLDKTQVTTSNTMLWLDFYLHRMKQAEAEAGKRLLDVLDLHWYPEARNSDKIGILGPDTTPTVVAARLQAPRSLWDPNYVENSWITEYITHGKAINLLPWLAGKIANYYPETKLAITEYNYGAGQDISGGIAQADVLGIFWPLWRVRSNAISDPP
jgi:hypothetical protein